MNANGVVPNRPAWVTVDLHGAWDWLMQSQPPADVLTFGYRHTASVAVASMLFYGRPERPGSEDGSLSH